MRRRVSRLSCVVVGVLSLAGSAEPLCAQKPPNVQSSIGAADRATSGAASRKRSTKSRRVRSPLLYTAPVGSSALSSELSRMLRARTTRGSWGIAVASLTRGDTLFSYRPDALMVPASVMKLYTTAVAYERLGPRHQLRTEILRTGPMSPDGTVYGDLVLRGGGDPALSWRYMGGDSPAAPAELLAAHVAAAGIRRVRGNLIADETAFDARRIPLGWPDRYLSASYAPRISALSLNENMALVYLTPAGSRARADLVPPSATMRVINQVRTVAGRRSRVAATQRDDSTIVVSGTLGRSGGARAYSVMITHPALFAAGAFRSALAQRGIAIEGDVVVARAPNDCLPVATVASLPLAQLAAIMNGESVNHFAELLYHNAARSGDVAGSLDRANFALDSLLTFGAGVAPGAVAAADGSGLSTLDRITPRSLAQLLGYAHRATWAADFHASLPVAGRTDLLRRRMRQTPAAGNLHGKTGTLNDVVSLGGYVRSANGELLAFAFIYNGLQRSAALETIDAMGATLAAFSR
ncbi:MAG: D-alanyl-D-alanine carboxypeptidase/D-alanyl-D-alanine endopeptidase [Gemmatimonadaceae bacterium]